MSSNHPNNNNDHHDDTNNNINNNNNSCSNSSNNTNLDQSAVHNDAGVRMLQLQNYDAALALFRRALESKLAYEHANRSTSSNHANNNNNNHNHHGVVQQQQPQLLQERRAAAAAAAANPNVARCVTPELPDTVLQAESILENCNKSSNATGSNNDHTNNAASSRTVIAEEMDEDDSSLSSLHRESISAGASSGQEQQQQQQQRQVRNDTAATSAWSSQQVATNSDVVMQESTYSSLFLYMAPFNVPTAVDPEATATAAAAAAAPGQQAQAAPIQVPQLTSAVIVFNLGLVHHLQNRHSHKASSFYEIATALLSSWTDTMSSSTTTSSSRNTQQQLPLHYNFTMMLRMALMNNFAVWCYENDDMTLLQTCLEHLAYTIQGVHHPTGHVFRPSNANIRHGVSANIRFLLPRMVALANQEQQQYDDDENDIQDEYNLQRAHNYQDLLFK